MSAEVERPGGTMEHDVPEPVAAAIQLKHAHEAPAAGEGVQVPADRSWARGVAKAAVDLDAWMAELGPSDALRAWFGHRPDRWAASAERYRDELATPLRAALQGVADRTAPTLVYGAPRPRARAPRTVKSLPGLPKGWFWMSTLRQSGAPRSTRCTR